MSLFDWHEIIRPSTCDHKAAIEKILHQILGSVDQTVVDLTYAEVAKCPRCGKEIDHAQTRT
jgi:hypothetical protein